MTQPPYNKARRVFRIMDNGSSHRGAACVKRLVEKYPRIVPVHGPVHASWLNQIEIYFSILQRKVLTRQRLSVPGSGQRAPLFLRAALRGDREAVRMEIHA